MLALSVGNLTAREHYKAVADTCLQPAQLQLDTSVRPQGRGELENGLAKRRGINVAARSQAGNRLRGQTISTASHALAFISINIARIANAVQVTICLLVSTSVY